VPTALIGLASDAQSGGSMFELKIDGIFGLGPPRSDDLCGFESPLYTAYKNKLINKSIFSVYMHNSKDSGNGEYGGGEKGLISLVVKSPNIYQFKGISILFTGSLVIEIFRNFGLGDQTSSE